MDWTGVSDLVSDLALSLTLGLALGVCGESLFCFWRALVGLFGGQASNYRSYNDLDQVKYHSYNDLTMPLSFL